MPRDDRRDGPKALLYRKVNTRARGVRHRTGGDFRHERHTKRGADATADGRGTMHGTVRRGLDYTPLFRFLLSKVGARWTDVHREAVARLDCEEPIFWMVALREEDRRDVVLLGERTFFSGLYVDADDVLRVVNPALRASDMELLCTCCTHTFNGVRFG